MTQFPLLFFLLAFSKNLNFKITALIFRKSCVFQGKLNANPRSHIRLEKDTSISVTQTKEDL